MLKPKRSLGQNFLNDKNILNKISKAINSNSDDFVLEIGPGTGALTEFILNSKPKKFIAVDLDERSIELLNDKYVDSLGQSFELIHSDIREINLSDKIGTQDYREKIVAGNIPYNISADIFFWLFANRNLIDRSILMIQKEVAQRLIAKKGNKVYSILSVVMNLVGNAKILFDVSPNCFYPKPKVTSSVIEFVFNKNISDKDFKELLSLIKACFGQRRKVLRNSLKTYLSNFQINDENILSDNLVKYFSMRAEELDVVDFVKIRDEIKMLAIGISESNEK